MIESIDVRKIIQVKGNQKVHVDWSRVHVWPKFGDMLEINIFLDLNEKDSNNRGILKRRVNNYIDILDINWLNLLLLAK